MSPQSYAQETQLKARAIAVAPYGIAESQADESLEYKGVYYDFLDLILQQLHVPYIQEVAPYARISKDLRSGKADITIMYRYQHLADDVYFIQPLPSLTNVVIGDAGLSITHPNDLVNKKVAYLRGANFSNAIDQDPRIEKYFTLDIAQAVALLSKGRVDAVIGPLSPILYAADKLGIVDQLGKPFVVSERTPWLQISKKSPLASRARELKSITVTLLQEGWLTKFKQNYHSPKVKAWLKDSGIAHN
ncbi:substrate-binding periplasmic protein [Pseudoalteromonas rubra]|uniref:Uncharacterized protein n=1 Tax=Pseudoalteromonas rubra TaxID=43658 RepID=A0A0U3HNJ2_9GAMM|nr:transporter substrate-binding domain-containing protein [Pseudoalteromonas rubra]ALU44501.1 hypothetical protein AT705_17130 [Pseudoalteromonas rubra]